MKNSILKHLFTFLTIIICSCKGDPSSSTTYIYKNNSGEDILLDEMYSSTLRDSIIIKNNEVYKKIKSYEGGGPNYEEEAPIYTFAFDSIDVIYNHVKHKLYHINDTSSRNILNTKSYEMHQINEGNYEMYYTFTEQDYLDADSIK